MKKRTEIYIADLHINSTVSICPERVALDDNGFYRASSGQLWLWRNWQNLKERIKGIDGDKYLVIDGDAAELDDKKRSTQLISRNKEDIQRMVLAVIDELAEVVDGVEVIRGTEAHTGQSGWIEEIIARNYIENAESDKVYSKEIRRVEISGVRVEVSHHSNMSNIPLKSPQAAGDLAGKVMVEYWKKKERPPDLVIRAHNHRWSDSADNYLTRVIMLPAWTLATNYINRINPDALAEIGARWLRMRTGNSRLRKSSTNR